MIWKARMYPTCGINCQILPYVSNKRKKWKIRLKIWYGKIGNSEWRWHLGAKGVMNSQSLPRFSRTNSLKQRKIEVKIWHDNLGYIPLAWRIVRTYPVFLEFVEQMENQSEDWTLQVMILTTSRKNCHDLPRFSRVNCTNRGKDWIWKSYIIHL